MTSQTYQLCLYPGAVRLTQILRKKGNPTWNVQMSNIYVATHQTWKQHHPPLLSRLLTCILTTATCTVLAMCSSWLALELHLSDMELRVREKKFVSETHKATGFFFCSCCWRFIAPILYFFFFFFSYFSQDRCRYRYKHMFTLSAWGQAFVLFLCSIYLAQNCNFIEVR